MPRLRFWTSSSVEAIRGTSDSVRKPWAIVLPPGISRLARSTSTWIHWWSPVASANLSIIAWSTVIQSDGPSSVPTSFKRSFGYSTLSVAGIPSSSQLPAGPRGHGPGHLPGVARLERGDLGLEAQRQADLVSTGQQHLLAKRVDLEAVLGAVRRGHRLRLEIDRERGARAVVELAPQARGGVSRKD